MDGKYGFVLGVTFTALIVSAFFLLQQGALIQQIAPAQKTPQTSIQKIRVSGWSTNHDFQFTDAAKDLGIWARNGLDPEWVYVGGRLAVASDIKEQLASGIKIGVNAPIEVLLSRADGLPVKIVAGYYGEPVTKLFVKGDGPINSTSDLDGRRIGVISGADFTYRLAVYMSGKFKFKAEITPIGNLTNQVVALKLGKIDAFIASEASALRLVDSGELRILMHIRDILPKPYTSLVIWASVEAIEQNPELVRSYVKAHLETIKYLKENPSYAADIWVKKTNGPRDLADQVVAEANWTPSGRGSGQDLVAAVTNGFQWNKESGAVPADINVNIEEAIDTRFLP